MDSGVDRGDTAVDSGNGADSADDIAADASADAADVPKAVPTVLLPPRDPSTCASMDLALVGATLFWTDETRGQVRLMSVTGGEPVTIVSGEDHPKSLVVRGGTAFWLGGPTVEYHFNPDYALVQQSRAMLRSAPIAGGQVATVVAPTDGVTGFTTSPDGQTVYFGVSMTVQKISPAAPGATPVEVARNEVDVPAVFAIEGSILSFLTNVTFEAKAVRLVDGDEAVCLKGAAPGHLCAVLGASSYGSNGSHALAAQDGRFYWGMPGEIRTAPAETTPLTYQQFVPVDTVVQSIAISGRTLVFTTFGPQPSDSIGIIGQASLDGSTFTTLADGENSPASIVTDGARAYWSTADCAIKSVPLR